MSKRDRRILQELVYERLCAAVDADAVLGIQADLMHSIDRVVRSPPPAECALLAQTMLQRAWRRVGRDALGKLAEVDE